MKIDIVKPLPVVEDGGDKIFTEEVVDASTSILEADMHPAREGDGKEDASTSLMKPAAVEEDVKMKEPEVEGEVEVAESTSKEEEPKPEDPYEGENINWYWEAQDVDWSEVALETKVRSFFSSSLSLTWLS